MIWIGIPRKAEGEVKANRRNCKKILKNPFIFKEYKSKTLLLIHPGGEFKKKKLMGILQFKRKEHFLGKQ